MLCNWLRVLGTAERSQVDQPIRQSLHPIVPLLDACKTEPQPLALICPRKGPLDLHPPGMAPRLAQPLAPTRGALAVAGGLCEIGEHIRMKYARAMRSGGKAAVEMDIRASAVPPDLFRHLFPRFQALRSQDHGRLMDGCHRQGRQHGARVVGHGDALLSCLGLVARVATAIAPFGATVLGPSPWSTRRAS